MLSPRYSIQTSHIAVQRSPRFFHVSFLALATFVAMLVGTSAHAADSTQSNANAAYQRQRTACMNGTSNEDRATCLREAGAALQAAKKGQLTDPQAQLEQNRLSRCNALPEQDRSDCVQRMQPGGVVEGNSRSGGILRESVTTEVGPPVIINPPANNMPGGSQ
ncbi:hypothetical protein [Glaciimonas sp. PAMC28666]|uniref:hypothetical protein n=1 Tax=Glaciimonas sp. PAMC28666 TaxID=2807626 RepID=UPI001962F516|nr:hypothetical protein [Glaciimonas sp. PAMC28666]QRX82048.1 hypothetical protein JQN73_18320 [Glaciimonas sp. PAMC28666]